MYRYYLQKNTRTPNHILIVGSKNTSLLRDDNSTQIHSYNFKQGEWCHSRVLPNSGIVSITEDEANKYILIHKLSK
jgi:hypothetical protein